MAEIVNASQFLNLAGRFRVVDVRAPSEFESGHIPGAVNIPLFTDEERKEVGTAYKQINRESAMYKGLEYAGRKLVSLAKEGEKSAGRSKTLLVHCWRGGMRSRSMVWLFETMGIKCYLLEGGYKSYRTLVHDIMDRNYSLLIVGGRTGSGKTDILFRLKERGEQVVDLEFLAHHKGSAFGGLGEEPQPSTEQFENILCQELMKVDPNRRLWVEDESRNVGRCVVPGAFYEQMKSGRTLFLDLDRELRASHLVKQYAGYAKEELKFCIEKITKKLGGDRTREALEAVDLDDFFKTAMITLHYYDKTYMFSLRKNHGDVEVLPSSTIDPEHNAGLLMNYVGKEEK